MKKILYRSAVICNILFAILLLLSYLSVLISPEKFPYLSLLGLAFPILIFINLLFLVLFIYKKKKAFLISIFVIGIGVFRIADFVAFNTSSSDSKIHKGIKVMSYNVRLFDLYEWSEIQNAGDKILDLLNNENADIICLQEFYSNETKNYQEKIIELHKSASYIISKKDKTGYSGNAIFSKYPIINDGFVNLNSINQKCIFADMLMGNDTFRIYSMHLASIHLTNDDYNFIKNINKNGQTQNIEGFKGISSKLLQASKIRSKEVDIIAKHIAESPYKTIVCGDFNDTPISYSYRKIKGKLKDSFLEAGFGIGNTYTKYLPLLRIDYIFHSPELKCIGFNKIKKDYSDHYSITAIIN